MRNPENIYNGWEPASGWTTSGKLRQLNFTKRQDFTAEVGPDPIDYFSFFVDEDFLVLICTETNLYAEKAFKESESWMELAVEELKIFLGLLLHMGTVKLNKLQDYWRSTPLFNIPIFKEQMSEDRFFLILRCLRFASDMTGEDPLAKIREVTYYFNEKMARSYYPGKDLSLSGMIVSKGRLMPLSRTRKYKNAVKFYALTEADGTVSRICVDGKSGKEDIRRCVLNLMEGKMNNGHTLYTGSYFNSYNLAKSLLENGTHCTGPLRMNTEGNPAEITEKTLKRGHLISIYNGGVHVGKWKEKKIVTYLTTEHKTKKDKCTKPEAVQMYENHISDRKSSDETYAFYPFQSTTLRWYKKVFIHALQLLLINAHRFYNRYSGADMSFGDFRISIINALLPDANASIPSASMILTTKSLVNFVPPTSGSMTTHVVSKIEERSSSGRTKRKMCRLCSKSGKRADSVYHCLQCFGQPGMCLACFDIFHTMSEQ